MKSAFALLSLVTLALAGPLLQFETEGDQQLLGELPTSYPGFDLDLGEQRLVELEGQSPKWMTELEKIQLRAKGINFMDITDAQDLGSKASKLKATPTFPKPKAADKVKPILETLSTSGPRANLEKFTSFRTRYYRSDTGRQSQQWLFQKISEITDSSSASKRLRKQISITEFPHSWGQNSIIVRINGTSTTDDGVVIISAHQDSTNMWPFLPAPGADDDGSGTVTILEAYRALIASNFLPERTVEFHWYSAEEGGLLGSQQVAKDYEARQTNVVAMSQFDMTAWVKKGTREEVGIITDFVDPALTRFNMDLVDTYLSIPYVETKCGYACSDHASWSKIGAPAAFTIESEFANSNKLIHSANDRLDVSPEFSFSHMLEFSKLAVAFAVELGRWSKDA